MNVISMTMKVKFEQSRIYRSTLGQIRVSNLVEFKFIDQIRPRVWISNSTFSIEFRIFSSRIWNSSELTWIPNTLNGINVSDILNLRCGGWTSFTSHRTGYLIVDRDWNNLWGFGTREGDPKIQGQAWSLDLLTIVAWLKYGNLNIIKIRKIVFVRLMYQFSWPITKWLKLFDIEKINLHWEYV